VRSSIVTICTLCLAASIVQGAEPKPLNLTGPEVIKIDWNSRSLNCADIDGDGFNDLAAIDNDTGKIEILFQNNPANPKHKERKTVKRNRWDPALEDAHFWHDNITMGSFGFDMALGDFDGDGRIDVAYTGNITPLTVRYQDENGQWDKSWTYGNLKPQQWPQTVTACDIDGDRRCDLAILADGEFLIFLQDSSGHFGEPKRYKISATGSNSIVFADISGDKLPDALFMCGTDRFRRISARIQQSPGVFGPEICFPMPVGSIALAVMLSGAKPSFLSIDGQTQALLSFSFEKGGDVPKSLETMQMRDYAIESQGKQACLCTYGDFDGDGRIDIAVADPDGARIFLLQQNADGDFEEARPYPSLSKINSISTLHSTNEPDRILITSGGEDIAGIVSYSSQKRLGFPTPLPTLGKPLCIAAGKFDKTGEPSIAIVEKRDDDCYLTNLRRIDGKGDFTRTSSVRIIVAKRKPDGMLAVPIKADGSDALLVFTSKETARIFVMADAGFKEIAADSTVRLACMNGADESRIGIADVDGDGVNELLVGSTGFARALRLKNDSIPEVVDQYNSRNISADVKGPALIRLLPGKKRPQLMFYDDAEDRFELLACDDSDTVYHSVEIRDSDSQNGFGGMSLLSLGRNGNVIVAPGQNHLCVIPLNKEGWARKSCFQTFETDLDKINYSIICTGDLNSDGSPEVIAADGQENLIEILETSGKVFQSAMHFVVFDKNDHANPRATGSLEPREMLSGDLNHDGVSDLAILVHDRVLVYTSQRPADLK
jgi:hypothetical protein